MALNELFAEIDELTAKYRLLRTKEKLRLKLMEEVGEYAVAALGDKVVTESERQELVDVILTAYSLFVLEGGSAKFLGNYGQKKLDKLKKKLKSQE